MQNKCIKLICNAGLEERIVDLQSKCNIQPIEHHIKKLSTKFYTNINIEGLKNDFIIYSSIEDMPFKYKYKFPYQMLLN